jgi:hypothetical protein
MRSLTIAQSGLQALLYLASRGCSRLGSITNACARQFGLLNADMGMKFFFASMSKLSLFLAAFKLGIGA